MLTDEEIAALLALPKTVTSTRKREREQKKSIRVNYPVESDCGSAQFELYSRQNQIDPDAYSCGLIYQHPSGERVTLVRYNGSNHQHRNPLESNELISFKCHIHRATSRYIEMGDKAEKFAETTDRYQNLDGALHCLVLDCNISGLHTSAPDDTAITSQMNLLDDQR